MEERRSEEDEDGRKEMNEKKEHEKGEGERDSER